MESVLKINNLKYKNILTDITLSLQEKTFNILVGSNGSGKTTLVNCIRGLINYQGSITLFNEEINKINDFNLYKQMGFFMQEEIILEDTIFDELLQTLKNLDYDIEKARKRIYALARKIGIIDVLFKVQQELLTYEKTLVSFAFSVIHEPKLLIIDNDLENLDYKYKNKIIEYLKNQKEMTILFITNNSEYFYNADNLLFLKEGKIVLSGSLEQTIKKESIFIKCGSNMPFNIDLSNKLISYELLDSMELDIEKMVNKVWK